MDDHVTLRLGQGYASVRISDMERSKQQTWHGRVLVHVHMWCRENLGV